MFDISSYNLHAISRVGSRTGNIGLYNIVYTMGAGANWLAYVMCVNILDLQKINFNIKNNEVMSSRNSFIVDIFHPSDIYYSPNPSFMIEKLFRSKLIIISLDEQSFVNTIVLANLKHYLNTGRPDVHRIPYISVPDKSQYNCLMDFKKYAKSRMPEHFILDLDYKKFFIDMDAQMIAEFENFIHMYETKQDLIRHEMLISELSRYSHYNSIIMKEHNLEQYWQWNF